METAGMMKMASDDDSPLRQSAGTGLRMRSLRYRGLRWQRGSSRFLLGFSIFIGIFGVGFTSRGPTRERQACPARPGGRACPPGLSRPRGSFGPSTKLRGSLLVPKKSSKSFAAFGLHLIWIFWKTKNKQKTATGTGH
jgi:hypothetical protein